MSEKSRDCGYAYVGRETNRHNKITLLVLSSSQRENLELVRSTMFDTYILLPSISRARKGFPPDNFPRRKFFCDFSKYSYKTANSSPFRCNLYYQAEFQAILCYIGLMLLFNNYYFRYFSGGFLVGASVVAVARSTNKIKDLKIESISGNSVFTGGSAWLVVGTIFGIFGGIIGLGTRGLMKRIERA